MIGTQEVNLVQLIVTFIFIAVGFIVLTEMKHRYYIKEFGEPARKMFEEDGIL